MELAATDGHRLAVVQINYDPDETKKDIIDKEPQIVLPNESVNVLRYSMKQIEEADDVAEMVEFRVDEHIIQCNLSEGMIKTRRLDGKYPAYSQLINRDTDSYETTVTLSRKELIEGLEFISSFAVDKNRVCFLAIDPINDFCTVQAEDDQLGSAKANASAEVKGTSGEMGFNTKYLTECLKAFGEEKVNLYVSPGHPSAPILVTAEETGENIGEHLAILMPIQITKS